ETEGARRIRAEAEGRGIAVLHAIAHTDSILWVQGIPGRGVISLSIDGTISETSLDGTSRILWSGVKRRLPFAYAISRHLLVYVCEPAALCFMDIITKNVIRVTARAGYSPIDLSFSPDGSQLAIIAESGDLLILDVAFPQQPTERVRIHSGVAGGVLFVAPDA